MAHLREFLQAIDYRITEGSDYQWHCFGPDARYLDCQGPELNEDYSISCIFDSKNQRVYMMEAWDYRNRREYRWIDAEFRKAHDLEAEQHGIAHNESFDGNTFIDLEVEEDILDKIECMVAGVDYDDRIKVPVDFTDEELLKYMKMAHERDMTFNQFVEEALRAAIEEHKNNPEEFAKRAESWKREKGIL